MCLGRSRSTVLITARIAALRLHIRDAEIRRDELLVELGSGDGLATCEFSRNVLAIKRLQDFSDIAVLHGVNVLEEGNQCNQLCVLRVARPFRQDYGIFGLQADVGSVCIDHNDFGEITIEIGQVLPHVSPTFRSHG